MTSIHPTTPDDFADWEPLWQGYLRFYESSVPDTVTRTTFARLTDPAEPMGSFLARDDAGRAIGMVNWIRHRSCWSEADSIYLQDLFADPAARGTGIGRALIEAVYAKASELGCARVHWLTHESNATAMLLYDRIAEKSGFINYRKQI